MKIILQIGVVLLLIIGTLLVILNNYSFKPKDIVPIDTTNNQEPKLSSNKEITISSFNIGYAGTDKEADSFACGGKQSLAASKEKVNENLKGITAALKENNSDFFLIQEIDTNSKRSYNINQLKSIQVSFDDYGVTFAYNHKATWIPIPVTHPMGKVESGLGILSKFKSKDANRYAYANLEKWPISMFKHKRCFVEAAYEVDNGKELIILNTHNSAFDKEGKARREELIKLTEYMKEQYEKGNYVIAGGDFNMLLPDTLGKFKYKESKPQRFIEIPLELIPNEFKWGIDKKNPTARGLKNKYIKGESFVGIVDGFLVSPNIDIVYTKTNNQDFKYSDHNLVEMKFVLK